VLTLMTNLAVVQILQFLVLMFFLLVAVAAFSARLHLPKTKCEPLIDVLLVTVLLIYAVVLKIIFST
ncbi:MAG: hypothetical protein MJ054_02140, partial [Clostridia bacterium]|nr:hypothetical protein [Clostridia bacterium]